MIVMLNARHSLATRPWQTAPHGAWAGHRHQLRFSIQPFWWTANESLMMRLLSDRLRRKIIGKEWEKSISAFKRSAYWKTFSEKQRSFTFQFMDCGSNYDRFLNDKPKFAMRTEGVLESVFWSTTSTWWWISMANNTCAIEPAQRSC